MLKLTAKFPSVPKISWPSHLPHAVLSEPQMAEHVVEVPTVVSPSFFSQFVEQNADIPVPGARGSFWNWRSSWCPPTEQRSSPNFSVEQIINIFSQFPVVQQFLAMEVLPEEAFHPRAFVRTFPTEKKGARVTRQVSAGVVEDSSSSTPATHEEPTPPSVVPQNLVPGHGVHQRLAELRSEETKLMDSVEWVQLSDDATSKTCYWNRRIRMTSWLPPEDTRVVWVGEKAAGGAQGTRVSTYDLPPLPPM